jgi:EpsI family protein
MKAGMNLRLLLVTALIAATLGYLRLAGAVDVQVSPAPLLSLPHHVGAWTGVDLDPLDAATTSVLQADAYVLRAYTRGRIPVTLFVAYYASQRAGHTIHSPLNCLPGSGWEWVARRRDALNVAATTLDLNRNVARRGADEIVVDYWYQRGERALASEYSYKIQLVVDQLRSHRSDGALIRVTAPASSGPWIAAAEAEDFVRSVYRPLVSLIG